MSWLSLRANQQGYPTHVRAELNAVREIVELTLVLIPAAILLEVHAPKTIQAFAALVLVRVLHVLEGVDRWHDCVALGRKLWNTC